MTELIEQAMALKRAQVDRDRPVWNSWPAFLQNTLFHKEPIVQGRLKPSVDEMGRMPAVDAAKAIEEATRASQVFRNNGNALFTDGKFTDAVFRYEEAVAHFDYVVPTHADWQKRGIRDEDLAATRFSLGWRRLDGLWLDAIADGRAEAALAVEALREAVKHLASTYANLALAAEKQRRWDIAAAASRHVLDHLDAGHLKAARRLATALTAPDTATAVHTDSAIAVLKAALAAADAAEPAKGSSELAAQRRDIVALVEQLSRQRAADDAKGRQMFGGLFERAEWKDAPDRTQHSGTQAGVSFGQRSDPRDRTAAFDASRFPPDMAKAPIYKDTCQGWRVVAQMRDEARAIDGRSLADDERADGLRAKADKMEADLVSVAVRKVYDECMVPAMCNTPALLTFDVPEDDPLLLNANAAIVHARSIIRLLGFDPAEWVRVCGRARDNAVPPAAESKEARLFHELQGKCRAAYADDQAQRYGAFDAGTQLVASGALPDHVSVSELSAAEKDRENATAKALRRALGSWRRRAFDTMFGSQPS